MKKVLAIAVIALFVLPLVLTITTASANPSSSTTTSGPPSTGDKNRDHALSNAEQRNMFGLFTYDSGNVSGRFLTFRIDETTGTITDYTIRRTTGNILLLTQVQLASFTSASAPRVDGAMFVYNGTKMRIMAHNNPPAILLYRTQGAANTVTYTLASGFTASAIPGSANVKIDSTTQHALLLIENGTATINASEVTVNLEPWAKSVLRFQPDIGLQASLNQTKVQEAVSSGKLACECSIAAYNGTAEQDTINYQERLMVRIIEAVQNRLTLNVSAEFQEGKIVAINVDNETIQAQNREQVGLTIDGIRIQQAASIGEVFAAQGTGNTYYVSSGDGTFQVLIYIGHFSEHTIVVEPVSAADGSSMSLIIPIIALVSIVALVAIVVVARKRQTA